MKTSVVMNAIIPLMCHFMFMRGITNPTDFLLSVYDRLITIYNEVYDIDIYAKLYETIVSNVLRTAKRNKTIWNMQDIRGIDTTTITLDIMDNLVINIMPKYRYDGNLVHLNYKSVSHSTGFQVLDIEYEFNFRNLSSSKRDEDYNSEFDKFESFLQKSDEALLMQSQTASDDAMNQIRMTYGPFDQDEIQFYKHRLSEDGRCTVNSFQRDLIFNLFFKFFGDSNSLNAINLDDYVTLIIAAKRILETSGMVILPYIVSAKVTRLATRKNVNKKEMTKLESSPLWEEIKNKYRNDKKIEKHIIGLIAQALASDFEIISYDKDELDGQPMLIIPEIICEEILIYITLI